MDQVNGLFHRTNTINTAMKWSDDVLYKCLGNTEFKWQKHTRSFCQQYNSQEALGSVLTHIHRFTDTLKTYSIFHHFHIWHENSNLKKNQSVSGCPGMADGAVLFLITRGVKLELDGYDIVLHKIREDMVPHKIQEDNKKYRLFHQPIIDY